MNFAAFDEVVSYLDSFSYKDKTQAPGIIRDARLERMEILLKALDNPEKNYKTLHLAGSKGKGSTGMYLAALLKAKGYRTGLYLSPHLKDYRERFTLAGEFFDDSFLLKTAEKLYEKTHTLTLPESLGPVYPSTFEMYTAYAYLLFAEAGCTWAVIETGMGGRLDATNTIESTASILLPIELEHTSVLGNTIAEIATEKSKIIKHSDKGVFVSLQKDEALEVFKREAESKGVPLFSLASALSSLSTMTKKEAEVCHIAFTDGTAYDLRLSMKGEVMAENAALAILCAKKLSFLTDEGLREIEKAKLPGRFEEIIKEDHTITLDVAHTGESMKHTISSFIALHENRRARVCIFGSVLGKDTHKMLREILKEFDRIIISRPGSFKKSDINGIYQEAMSLKSDEQMVLLIEEAEEAYSKALESGKDILITGSFYLSAEFEEVINVDKLK